MQISQEAIENMFVFSSFMIMVLKTNSSKNTSIEKKKNTFPCWFQTLYFRRMKPSDLIIIQKS
jgi:hypothetical protein